MLTTHNKDGMANRVKAVATFCFQDVGPDGTIYADLTFAQSAPAAVKRDEDEDDDDDKVVYAAIDFKKNT